ncbi:hypothetical protein EGT74_22475 [Chitinophaga lutea]|uniref:Uncharacterized protein n=1 Tax=Chitinophaga lutea TaxID=2488634 RepID=A0A3N4PX86_9BACT|nr:hypothetical protein [Chitinophaga lutea]RPE09741.1 hypothetical protein EGT74_22475 [Chitinophaga lutea]
MLDLYFKSLKRGEVYRILPNWGVERVCYGGPVYDVQSLRDGLSAVKSWQLMCYDCHGDDFAPISKEEYKEYFNLMRERRNEVLRKAQK